MIELKDGALVFSFPEVHPHARLKIAFHRTLRIPDDNRQYPLPPGLGAFPLRHVDDFSGTVAPSWRTHGGVMLPMYQAEALWIAFISLNIPGYREGYPFAVKIAAGKINAVSGQVWTDGSLHRNPQDYLVSPDQPWLDGYCVGEGAIRQFVAMPLGEGYSAEEQITGNAEFGGLQILAAPMKREAYERYFKPEPPRVRESGPKFETFFSLKANAEMGLAAGGRMKQQIYEDAYNLEDWSTDHSSRCFVHICNSTHWKAITGANPPTRPPTAQDYTNRGLPWFEYYSEQPTLKGSDALKQLTGLAEMNYKKGQDPLPDNEPLHDEKIIEMGPRPKTNRVREWDEQKIGGPDNIAPQEKEECVGFLDFLKLGRKSLRYGGGDGQSIESAVVIHTTDTRVGVPAEYEYIAMKHGPRDTAWSFEGQMTTSQDDKKYDVLTIRLNSGEIKSYYFDITRFFGKF